MNISPLQKERLQYQPKLPGMLRHGIAAICVKEGEETQSVADQEKIKELFPNTYGKKEITFEKGENTKLTLTGGDGSEPEWRSEDSSVAKVSSTGVVQAVGEGDVTITATVGDETVECLVRCQFE